MTTDDILDLYWEKVDRYMRKYTNCQEWRTKISKQIDLEYNSNNELFQKNTRSKRAKRICSQTGDTHRRNNDELRPAYQPILGVRRGRGRAKPKNNSTREWEWEAKEQNR